MLSASLRWLSASLGCFRPHALQSVPCRRHLEVSVAPHSALFAHVSFAASVGEGVVDFVPSVAGGLDVSLG